MLSNLKNVFKIPDLRNKILFTVAMIVVYRLGIAIRVPGIDNLAVDQIKSAANTQGALGLPEPVLRRRLRELLDLRPRDHAVHHGEHHHADPRRGDPQAGGAPAAGRRRSAQDHPVHPLRHDRAGHAAGDRPGVHLRHRPGHGVLLGRQPGADGAAAARRHLAARLPRHPDAGRRHRRADVDRRADQPAGHRQRHVDDHLRLGRVGPALRLLLDHRGQQVVLVRRHRVADVGDHRGGGVRRARATADTGAVRQTCGRPPHVRRPEHLHPAEGQPVGRHPDHLRQLDPAAAGHLLERAGQR